MARDERYAGVPHFHKREKDGNERQCAQPEERRANCQKRLSEARFSAGVLKHRVGIGKQRFHRIESLMLRKTCSAIVLEQLTCRPRCRVWPASESDCHLLASARGKISTPRPLADR